MGVFSASAGDQGEGEATGAEWRTTPLWGIGLSACVTGGVEGPFQNAADKTALLAFLESL